MSDPVVSSADSELRAHVERVLSDHYELDSEIGRGGMGIVYRAKDRRLKRTVAIKLLPPELAFRSDIKTRFLREAETAAQLSHPNIVPIYTVDETEGLVFFVMAYVDGENLAKRIFERGVLPSDEVRKVLRDVADALAYAHERGVVHRDIKPDNIIIAAQTGRPMVTDFGIARAVSDGDSRLTATGMAIGTPAYMSPEQAAGERTIDGRSDLYSLGIVAYQMLAGEPPFVAGSTPAMLVKHISERPIPVQQRRADMPDDLARAVMLLLEKDPANRFPSASALVAALDSGNVPSASARTSGATAPNNFGAPDNYGSPASRTQTRTSGDGMYAPAPYEDVEIAPTVEDMARWEAEPVRKFRRKLAPYLFVNGVIVIASLVGDRDYFAFTVLWSIYMAFKYARLWADGYDWRDVFRQPRERELLEVVDDGLTRFRALFDSKQRLRLREEKRARRLARRAGRNSVDRSMSTASPSSARVSSSAVRGTGRSADLIAQAARDRDEIERILQSLPQNERNRLADVLRSSQALYEKIEALALSLSSLERSLAPGAKESVEAEIARLEGAANPLEGAASDERVRRLAQLRRQRRAMADLVRRRDEAAEKLETCAIALQNMKLDMVRLRAGSQTYENVTTLAVNAMSLADSVDSALYVADEMGRLGRRPTRSPAGP
ncbi:MAG TPA: serine/threonine-protein kinase [Gemmatimonadaceae bacterium]|nr:serine/threonine-protein kinase [Gemmatimonadaceae bacterium]